MKCNESGINFELGSLRQAFQGRESARPWSAFGKVNELGPSGWLATGLEENRCLFFLNPPFVFFWKQVAKVNEEKGDVEFGWAWAWCGMSHRHREEWAAEVGAFWISSLTAQTENHGSSVSRVPQPGLQRVCLSNAFVFGEQLSALLLWDAGKNRSIWTLSYLHVSTIPGQPVISRQRCCDIRGDFVAWGTVHKQLAPCAISFLLQNFHLLIYSCVGQKTTFRSWFSPASVSRGDRTQVLRFKFAAPTSPCHPLTLTPTEQTARSIFFSFFHLLFFLLRQMIDSKVISVFDLTGWSFSWWSQSATLPTLMWV